MTFIDPALVKSKVLELLFPLICLSLALLMPVGAGVFAAEEVGEDEDELITGVVGPCVFDSFFSFSFLILGLNSVMTTVKSSTVTL